MNNNEFKDKIKDSMFWWLGKKKPFILNAEYKLELLFIDKVNNSAKIRITNLKNEEITELDTSGSTNERY
jgi:hypothetical protein